MASTQPARGMRDFLPLDVRRRGYVVDVIRSVYERYGFEPLETPAVENIETLLGKYGEEGNKLIFKILKRGEHEASGQADLALRYDLTVPLARVVAEHHASLPKFFRRYQIQPVWRADRPARGRFREFYQCDVDALGSTSMAVEAEICAAICDVLAALGFRDFVLRVNHRQLLDGVLERVGVPAALQGEALVAVDKLDKVGREGVRSELAGRGVGPAAAGALLDVFERARAASGGTDGNVAALDRMREVVAGHQAGEQGLAELREVLRLSGVTAAAGHLRIDVSLARGLSYYTGTIMEIAVADLAGSLGGGGRYDRLVGMFLGRDVPACGFSLGLERILVVMQERGMFPEHVTRGGADVMVTRWDEGSLDQSLALARELREAGLRVDVYPEPDKIDKQIKYASACGVTCVAILGDDERAAGTVTIRDLRSREQRSVERRQAPDEVKQRLTVRTGDR